MVFCNKTSSTVFLEVNLIKYTLKPEEEIIVNCAEKSYVTLQHNYKSQALSKKEIALDHMDDSVITLLLSSHKPPYFDVVLDCHYQVHGSGNTIVNIYRQKIRPIYECSYDRLYLSTNNGYVGNSVYTFKENIPFKNHYLTAISSGNIKIVYILLLALGICSFPLIVLCVLANNFLGYLYIALFFGGLFSIYIIGKWFSKILCKAQLATIANKFDSYQINRFFQNMKQDDIVEE